MMSMTVTTMVAVSMMLSELAVRVSVRVLLSLLLRFIFIDASDDYLRCIFRSHNLDEWVLMTKAFFANFAVVEVLAHAALVSNTNDWMDTASVTSDI